MKRTKRKVSIALIALVVLALFMAGCDLAGGQAARISPPSWIRGTWELKVGSTLISSLTFSSDNVVFQVHEGGGLGFNFKDLGRNPGVSITDNTVSDTVYKLTMVAEGTKQVHTFTKRSDTVLDMHQDTNGIIITLDDFVKK